MSTVIEKLQYAIETKNLIKNAVNEVNPGAITPEIPFREYPEIIKNSISYIYRISEPVNFTLYANNWVGNNYLIEIPANTYTIEKKLHIDIPLETSTVNKDYVVESALTLPYYSQSYTRFNDTYNVLSINISASKAPTEDVEISIYGLAPFVRNPVNPFTFSDIDESSNYSLITRILDGDETLVPAGSYTDIYLKNTKFKVKLTGVVSSSATGSVSYTLTVKINGVTKVNKTSTLSDDAVYTTDYIDVTSDTDTIEVSVKVNNS